MTDLRDNKPTNRIHPQALPCRPTAPKILIGARSLRGCHMRACATVRVPREPIANLRVPMRLLLKDTTYFVASVQITQAERRAGAIPPSRNRG